MKKRKLIISPSILSSNFSILKDELSKIKEAGAEWVHFDVMDNHFVPNLTFGYKFVKDFRKHSDLIFDVHLMIDEPEKSIDSYIDAGSDIITFHYEACKDVKTTLENLKEKGIRAGLSIKPHTNLDVVFPYLDLLDMILIMTVEPGFSGQSMIRKALDKIPALIRRINGQYDIDIQIDGGVNIENIKEVTDLGANVIVMGSAFFKEKDYKAYVEQIKRIVNDK